MLCDYLMQVCVLWLCRDSCS